ncbi:A24 family peptidase [Desulfofundulus thermosubterraneus]|uniref:Prepilin peptidase CpaA n=1 Tax=Desulfofundulus thermosubterraneus DSM 16057 TaxID=1121432 RepID=A0A1M6D7L3_9FIRM|nr:A24 family peptidase [Desulfofundulus thermosubterraneus]SHI69226.1 prepilin peptidase CpaA [Desulfofundulus thermosubterraneus DSM 16057]
MSILDAVLAAFLCCSVYTDLRWRRIPNALVAAFMGAGFILRLAGGGPAGLLEGCLGLVIGALLLLIPFWAGGVGAGDVKMLAMIGLYKGAHFATWTFLAGALAGGVLAALFLLGRRHLVSSLRCVGRHLWLAWALGKLSLALVPPPGGEDLPAVPYALAIFCGATVVFILEVSGHALPALHW